MSEVRALPGAPISVQNEENTQKSKNQKNNLLVPRDKEKLMQDTHRVIHRFGYLEDLSKKTQKTVKQAYISLYGKEIVKRSVSNLNWYTYDLHLGVNLKNIFKHYPHLKKEPRKKHENYIEIQPKYGNASICTFENPKPEYQISQTYICIEVRMEDKTQSLIVFCFKKYKGPEGVHPIFGPPKTSKEYKDDGDSDGDEDGDEDSKNISLRLHPSELLVQPKKRKSVKSKIVIHKRTLYFQYPELDKYMSESSYFSATFKKFINNISFENLKFNEWHEEFKKICKPEQIFLCIEMESDQAKSFTKGSQEITAQEYKNLVKDKKENEENIDFKIIDSSKIKQPEPSKIYIKSTSPLGMAIWKKFYKPKENSEEQRTLKQYGEWIGVLKNEKS